MAVMGPTTTGHVQRLAGNLLKLARARAGASQRELADAAHVAQSTIARIESGVRQPSLPVLARILAALDLEVRITLAPYDSHDDVLDAHDAALTPSERMSRYARPVAHVAGPRGISRVLRRDPDRGQVS